MLSKLLDFQFHEFVHKVDVLDIPQFQLMMTPDHGAELQCRESILHGIDARTDVRDEPTFGVLRHAVLQIASQLGLSERQYSLGILDTESS